jgi:hypothetical protein
LSYFLVDFFTSGQMNLVGNTLPVLALGGTPFPHVGYQPDVNPPLRLRMKDAHAAEHRRSFAKSKGSKDDR